MDLVILKKKLDGFRLSNGSIRDVSPEVLWELRQAWENFTGPAEQFRSEVGVQAGTLRNLLKSAKKLNHAIASAAQLSLPAETETGSDSGAESGSLAAQTSDRSLELVYDRGEKLIRFPDLESLLDFLKRTAA